MTPDINARLVSACQGSGREAAEIFALRLFAFPYALDQEQVEYLTQRAIGGLRKGYGSFAADHGFPEAFAEAMTQRAITAFDNRMGEIIDSAGSGGNA